MKKKEKLIYWDRLLPCRVRGIELTAIGAWLMMSLYLFTIGSDCIDATCMYMFSTTNEIVWATGLALLGFVHLFTVITSPSISYFVRLSCNTLGFFLASYLSLLGFLTVPDVHVVFSAALAFSLGWVVIRVGFIK